MPTLYRDYRPQTFAEVLGQNHVKITLQNEISAGRPASAYLFCGPRAVGKTTLARVLSKSLNCEKRKKGDIEPCNNCPSCRSITSGQNLDVVEIDAASNTGVDNVRENIISFARLAPAGEKFKVFIIDEVHMLSTSAFNALLKTIEEPPAYVIFILCTTEIQKVPTTIISRCERFDFKRISAKEIVRKLSIIATAEKIKIAPSVLNDIARLSGGHLRDAESLLGQVFSLGDKEVSSEQAELVIPHYNSLEAVSLLDYLNKHDAAKALSLINALVDSGVNIKVFINEIIALLRKVMLGKVNPELEATLGLELDDELEKRLGQVSINLDWSDIFLFTRRFLEAASDNKSPLIPQLPLELAVVELCFGPKTPAVISSPSQQLPPTSALKNNNIFRRTDAPKLSQPINKENKNKSEIVSAATKKEKIFPSGESFNLSLSEVMAKWPEFLIKIRKNNHSLSFVLQSCQPCAIANGELGLTFKYKFHLDRVNDPNINILVVQAAAEVFGLALKINAVLDESLEINREGKREDSTNNSDQPIAISEIPAISKDENKQNPPAVQAELITKKSGGSLANILKTFGGEIIN